MTLSSPTALRVHVREGGGPPAHSLPTHSTPDTHTHTHLHTHTCTQAHRHTGTGTCRAGELLSADHLSQGGRGQISGFAPSGPRLWGTLCNSLPFCYPESLREVPSRTRITKPHSGQRTGLWSETALGSDSSSVLCRLSAPGGSLTWSLYSRPPPVK